MKDFFILVFILLSIGGCGKPEEQYTSLDEAGLKGEVKKMMEMQYFSAKENGEYIRVLEPYVQMSVFQYNRQGNLKEHNYYLMSPDGEKGFHSNHIRSLYIRKDSLWPQIVSYNPDTAYYQFAIMKELGDQKVLEVYDRSDNRIRTHYLNFSTEGKLLEVISDTLHIRHFYEGDVLKYSVNTDEKKEIILEYNYPEYDRYGNWIKRETKEKGENGMIYSVTFREIEYY